MNQKINVYCDGSIQGGNPGGWAVGGWVAKRGEASLASGTIDLGESPDMTNNRAEYSAVKEALVKLFSLFLDDYDVVIHSDSKLVVEQLNDRWDCNNLVLKDYRDEIWKLCEKFKGHVIFKWIPREQNQEADTISRSLY